MLRIVYGCTMTMDEVELALKTNEIWEAMESYPDFVLLGVPNHEREEFNDDDFVIGYDVAKIPINKTQVESLREPFDMEWIVYKWKNFMRECCITNPGCMISVMDD